MMAHFQVNARRLTSVEVASYLRAPVFLKLILPYVERQQAYSVYTPK